MRPASIFDRSRMSLMRDGRCCSRPCGSERSEGRASLLGVTAGRHEKNVENGDNCRTRRDSCRPRRERLAWQIRGDQKRMADVEGEECAATDMRRTSRSRPAEDDRLE